MQLAITLLQGHLKEVQEKQLPHRGAIKVTKLPAGKMEYHRAALKNLCIEELELERAIRLLERFVN